MAKDKDSIFIGEDSQIYGITEEFELPQSYRKWKQRNFVYVVLFFVCGFLTGFIPLCVDNEAYQMRIFNYGIGFSSTMLAMIFFTACMFNQSRNKIRKTLDEVVENNNQLLKNFKDSVARYFKMNKLNDIVEHITEIYTTKQFLDSDYETVEPKYYEKYVSLLYHKSTNYNFIDTGMFKFHMLIQNHRVVIESIEIPGITLLNMGFDLNHPSLIWKHFNEEYGEYVKVKWSKNNFSIILSNPDITTQTYLSTDVLKDMFKTDYGEYLLTKDTKGYYTNQNGLWDEVKIFKNENGEIHTINLTDGCTKQKYDEIVKDLQEKSWVIVDKGGFGNTLDNTVLSNGDLTCQISYSSLTKLVIIQTHNKEKIS